MLHCANSPPEDYYYYYYYYSKHVGEVMIYVLIISAISGDKCMLKPFFFLDTICLACVVASFKLSCV